MSDDAPKPLKRKHTAKQQAAFKRNRTAGRVPKRTGSAYRPEVRRKAEEEYAILKAHRLETRLAAGTGLEPPAPPLLTTLADPDGAVKPRKEPLNDAPTAAKQRPGRPKAADLGAFQTPALPADLLELAQATPADTEDASAAPADRPRVRYTRMIGDAICQRIAEGVPLQAICELEGMPAAQQVLAWARTNPAFKALYDEARTLQADYLADLMLGLAQRVLDGDPRDSGAVKVAADILAKQAEWRAPRKFGPKLDLTVTETPKTPEQIRDEIKQLQDDLGIPPERRIH